MAKKRQRQTKAEKLAEEAVEAAYYQHFNRVPVNMMDIGKITKIGRDALAEGRDLDAAMIAAVPQFRTDG